MAVHSVRVMSSTRVAPPHSPFAGPVTAPVTAAPAGATTDTARHTARGTAGHGARWETQQGFDDLGRALCDVTFTVVDLETTGGSPAQGAMITEIGAVKVRGGEVLGEFQTLVNPHSAIPPFIAVLTGISDGMVADAPSIESALPAFLEFAAGTVLVAHNAGFDVGFLKHFAAEQQRPWPRFEVLDTVTLARRVVTRDESPNCKLSSLARLFGSSTTPNHRALADARATVDVLHALMERVGNQGVHTLEELRAFTTKVSPEQRRKRHLATALPEAPGVYLFTDERERVLYVGTSKNLRARVRTYFTASETRSRMGELVTLTHEVKGIECATALEAQVREIRLIAQHKPSYNKRSKFPEKVHFIKVTQGPWPRLSLVRRAQGDDADYLGPISSKKVAEQCLAALHETFPVRQCSQHLPKAPSLTPCALAEMGRCLSPCDGSTDLSTYAALVQQLREALATDAAPVVEVLSNRMTACSEQERFEEARLHRDRLAALVGSIARSQRLQALTGCPQMVAARREEDGRWVVHVIRYGRLVAAGAIPPGMDAHAYVEQLVASAETVVPGPGPTPTATAEESELVLRWLGQEGVRLVSINGVWQSPLRGAGRHAALHQSISESRRAGVPFDERRIARPMHRPVR